MRQETFILPSTAKIEFRQILLREENTMAAAVKQRRMSVDKTLSKVMTDCAIGVVDPGPYDFLQEGGKPDWDRMIKGDRLVAMLDLRTISYRDGHLFDADLRCPAGTCGEKFTWEIDLKEDLTRIDLPPESIQALKDGRPFDVTIDGRVVKFTLALGKTEQIYETLCQQNPGRDMACALRSRIVEVEGLKPREIMDWLDGRNGESEEHPGLTSEDAEELREAFDAVEGGVDTGLEADCPRCHTEFDFDLPFSGMFLPGRKIGKRFKDAKRAKRATQPVDSSYQSEA